MTSMQKPAPKSALITPSASPPTSRGFFPPPYRIPDSAPPFKRQRTTSYASNVASSSSASDQQINIHEERQASTVRLLDVWSSLAERYSRPLDQDDIIDLYTGKITKDRGVIRGASRGFEIGCFADPDEDLASSEAGGDGEEVDTDGDELDGLSQPPHVEERMVPPVAVMDPADAEDLREFLEAEKKRREAWGSEAEESSEENDDEDVGVGETEDEFSATADVDGDDDDAEDAQSAGGLSQPLVSLDDDESDDELGIWDDGDENSVHTVPKDPEAPKAPELKDDDNDEVEIIEPPIPLSILLANQKSNARKKAKALAATNMSKGSPVAKPATPLRSPPRLQLQTPPQSQSSSHTPDDDVSFSFSPSPTVAEPALFIRPRPKPRPIHRASAAAAASTSSLSAIPKLDLSKPRAKPLQKSSPEAMPPPLLRPNVATASKMGRRTKRQLEVVIDRAPSRSASRVPDVRSLTEKERTNVAVLDSQSRSQTHHSPGAGSAGGSHHPTPGDDGAEHEHSQAASLDGGSMSDDPLSLAPSSPMTGPKGKLGSGKLTETADLSTRSDKTKDRSVLKAPKARLSRAPSPAASTLTVKKTKKAPSSRAKSKDLPSPPPRRVENRKRKRVVSSSSVPDSEASHTLESDNMGRKEGAGTISRDDRTGPALTRHVAHSSKSDSQGRQKSRSVSPPPSEPVGRGSSAKTSKIDAKGKGRQHDSSSDAEIPNRGRSQSRGFSHAPYAPPPGPHNPRRHSTVSPHFSHPRPAQPPPPHDIITSILDPRAPFIMSQAVQQLSYLVAGLWTHPLANTHHPSSTTPPVYPPFQSSPWVPFTPSHNPYAHSTSSRSRGESTSPSSSAHATPTHSHPYSYDPMFFGEPLPPSSPPPPSSSPAKTESESESRPAIVERSKSRGRRVSFKIDNKRSDREAESREEDLVTNPSASTFSSEPHERGRSSRPPARNGRIKSARQHPFPQPAKPGGARRKRGSEDSDNDSPEESRRARGQTPGPSQAPSHDASAARGRSRSASKRNHAEESPEA